LNKLKQIQWTRPNFSLPPARRTLEKAVEKTLNGLKHFFKQSLRVGVASASLFLIGFVLMNAPAYGDVIKTSFLTWTGAPDDTSLEDHFVKADPVQQEILAFSNNPEEQKEAIPLLALAVTPPDNRLIIPKLDKNVPIIESDAEKLLNADWETLEDTFQDDLQNGVLHYPGTADPGEVGNVFITGHSSYYLWDPGRYKDVFARLAKLEVGDDIILYYDQQKYHYRVRETKEVKKDDVSVLSQTDEHILTLMTCVPLGTNLRRLIVVAEEVQENV
jgi:LPXTG-site transpeptidase (sortase) family protein